LKSEPVKKVFVDVYCDRPGGKKENLRLAQRRAESVKAYLEAQGIPSELMIARGFAAENFTASNHYPRNSKQNSRVELIFPSLTTQPREISRIHHPVRAA
jgi:outer membrane protein OmpA-like peptidoglycan-associated protein